MSTGVVLAVLLGALLHATWNALVKSSGDKQLDLALVHLLGGIAALPLLAWGGPSHGRRRVVRPAHRAPGRVPDMAGSPAAPVQ